MTILLFILVLSALVLIHELGHFLVARWRRVPVQEFGLGYPPRLMTLFTWKKTKFTLNAVPFGGFIRLQGEEPAEENSETPAAMDDFSVQPAWSRLAVIAAGPVANILFGVVAFSIVFGLVGVPRSLDGRPRIEAVMPDSPAAQAGLQPGDEIIGFEGSDGFVSIDQATAVSEFAQTHSGQEVTIVFTGPCVGATCPEETREASLYIRSAEETPEGDGPMGVVFTPFYFETSPWPQQLIQGIQHGIREALYLSALIGWALVNLFRDIFTGGGVPEGIAGPVGIVHQASQANLLTRGWLPLLEFAGLLSINLGIMNLLPIPALDGGRILFILLEKLLGAQRVRRIEGHAHYGGFIALIALILWISFRDVLRIFQT